MTHKLKVRATTHFLPMMSEQFLHEQLSIAFDYGAPKPEISDSITQNLNPEFELRDYQIDTSMKG